MFGNVVAQTENFLTYTNTNYGFTIKYPSDWNVDDSNITGMGVLFGKKPEGDVQVSRVPDPNVTASLEDEIKHMLLPGIEAHGFRLTELNTNTYFLSGYPAIRVIGIQHYPKFDVEIMETFIKSGANVYSVKYLSHPETYLTYLPIAQQMTDSFQVINAPSSPNSCVPPQNV
jgi:hypothetical protein